MPGVWLIGLAFPAALLAGVLVAFGKRLPYRYAIALGALVAGLCWLFGWGVLKQVVNPTQTFAVLFLQLALCTICCFVFAVAAMIAARAWGRR